MSDDNDWFGWHDTSEEKVLQEKLDIALGAFARIVGPSVSASTPKEVLKIYDIIFEAQDKIRKVGEDA